MILTFSILFFPVCNGWWWWWLETPSWVWKLRRELLMTPTLLWCDGLAISVNNWKHILILIPAFRKKTNQANCMRK